MKLYDYFRSTAAYRVRIALALKKVNFDTAPVHLLNEGGEQHKPAYRSVNPQGLVPALDDEGFILNQSLAIIEYLEETIPSPALLPKLPKDRALVRMLAQIVVSDMHPLNNLRVTNRLKSQFHASQEQVIAWYHHWLREGFTAIARQLSRIEREKPVCLGSQFTLADLCLIPQLFNAKRFEFPLDDFPLLCEIDEYCLKHEAFQPKVTE